MSFTLNLKIQGLFRLVPHVEGDRMLAVAPWTYPTEEGKAKHRMVVQWRASEALPDVPPEHLPDRLGDVTMTWQLSRARLRFEYAGAPLDFSRDPAAKIPRLLASEAGADDGLLDPEFGDLVRIREDAIAPPNEFDLANDSDENTAQGVLSQVLVEHGRVTTSEAELFAEFKPNVGTPYRDRFVNGMTLELGQQIDGVEMIAESLITGNELARISLEAKTNLDIEVKHVCPGFFLGSPDLPDVLEEDRRDVDFLWLYDLSQDRAGLRARLAQIISPEEQSYGVLPVPTRTGDKDKTGATECGFVEDPARAF